MADEKCPQCGLANWGSMAHAHTAPPAPDAEEGLASDLESLLYEHTDESPSHKTICEWIRRIATPRIRSHVEEQKQHAAAQARLKEATLLLTLVIRAEGQPSYVERFTEAIGLIKSRIAALEAAAKGEGK